MVECITGPKTATSFNSISNDTIACLYICSIYKTFFVRPQSTPTNTYGHGDLGLRPLPLNISTQYKLSCVRDSYCSRRFHNDVYKSSTKRFLQESSKRIKLPKVPFAKLATLCSHTNEIELSLLKTQRTVFVHVLALLLIVASNSRLRFYQFR